MSEDQEKVGDASSSASLGSMKKLPPSIVANNNAPLRTSDRDDGRGDFGFFGGDLIVCFVLNANC